MKRRPDLIVPIRDRRRRKRVLTLRNFGISTAAMLLLFLAITIRSEMRGPRPGEYGRIMERQTKQELAAQPRLEVVIPAEPVPDHTVPDPLLLAPAAREAYLGQPQFEQPSTASAMTPSSGFAPRRAMTGDGRVAIVGDSNGVAIVKTSTEGGRKLSGGVFKQ